LLEYEVFAMFHDLNKYIEVENDVTLIEQPFRRLEFNQLNPVSNINFEVNARNDPARGTINSLRVRWTRSTSELATRYRVRYSRNGAQYIEWGITAFTEVEIDNVTDGTYSVLIYAQNAAGKESIPATADFTIAYGGTDVVFGGSTLTIQPPIINNVS
jgi:predicted phage tail protein